MSVYSLDKHATHLEVAYDLTTGSFILALRLFFAVRRNAAKEIFSDNATNFLGAEAELQWRLQRLSQQSVIGELALRGIVWKHSPPLANHQGAVFESIIHLVRKVMVGLMEDRLWRTLDDQQLLTLAKEIEHVLNCRPLTRASCDHTDMSAITPLTILLDCLEPASAPNVFCKSDGLRSSW